MSNSEEHVGRFSDGGEVLGDDAPEKRHVGRFSDGGEVLGDDDAEKGHVGRFSEGEEELPDTPDKNVERRFSEGIEQGSEGK